MGNRVKVSIVVPVYNVAPYLGQCLDSLCQQTLEEIEIICVDDGSTDESLAMLRDYAERNPKIRVFENKVEGAGAAQARNRGVAEAQGEYLLILDSDDYFSLDLAEKTYQKAVSTGADIVLFDAQEFDNDSGEHIKKETFLRYDLLPDKEVFSPNDVANNLFYLTNGSPWNKLFRRTMVVDNGLQFQPIHVIDDSLFTFSAFAISEKITYIKEKLVFYRGNNGASQVSNTHRDPLSPVKMLSALHYFLKSHDLLHRFQHSFFTSVQIFVSWYFSSLNNYTGFHQLYTALQQQYLQELVFDHSEVSPNILHWAREIQETSCEDYIYQRYVVTDVVNRGIYFAPFPTGLRDFSRRVVLYGAGLMGKSFFSQNALCQYCQIVGWVDRNYENLGFPVTGLETLEQVDFDVVLLAIESKGICERVKESLLSMGIPLDKIVLGVE